MDSETERTEVPVDPLQVLDLRIYTIAKAKKDITLQVPDSSPPAAAKPAVKTFCQPLKVVRSSG